MLDPSKQSNTNPLRYLYFTLNLSGWGFSAIPGLRLHAALVIEVFNTVPLSTFTTYRLLITICFKYVELTGLYIHQQVTAKGSGGIVFQSHKGSTFVTYILKKLWACINYQKIILPFTTSAYITMCNTSLMVYSVRTTGFTGSVSSDLTMSLLVLSVIIPSLFSTPSILTRVGGGGWSRVGRTPMLKNCLICSDTACTLDWLWLLIPSLAPYLPVSEDNRDVWNLSSHILRNFDRWWENWGWIDMYLPNNPNDNQPWYWKV